jgi:hypothetical protein
MTKVSIAAIQLRAKQIAAKTGKNQEEVESALIKAHEDIKIGVDFSPPPSNGGTTLDFTNKADPKKTWPIPPSRTLS